MLRKNLLFVIFHINFICFSQVYFQKITNDPIVLENSKGVNGAWGDYDNDGYLDLVVGQATEGTPYPILLYRNNGNGTFTKVTDNIISQTTAVIVGICWGDYDNDGKIDLFCGNRMNTNILFHNEGNGVFTRVTNGIQVNEPARSASASWCDYDRDGWLDLFVSNSDYLNDYLYHNNGNGTFTKITSGPVVSDGVWSRGAAWGDYDNDGWMDLYVVADHGANDLLYHNNSNGTFTKITSGVLVNDGLWGVQCAWGDYNNDGLLDIAVTHEHGNNRVYKNEGNGLFSVNNAMPSFTTENYLGIAWGDYNNDTYLDLHIGTLPTNSFLLKNILGNTFVNSTNEVPANETGNDGVWADYNNDGRLDLLVVHSPSMKLYKNIGQSGNYLICKLIGCQSNKSAIGARINLYSGGNKYVREVSSGDGNQNMLWQHFGLGTINSIDSIIVFWPFGTTARKQILKNVSINTSIIIDECAIGINSIEGEVPENFSLSQNYPNPFNPVTNIRFDIPKSGYVKIIIYDLLGREITQLVNQQMQPGSYYVDWDASNYPSGVYFYSIEAGDYKETRKMVLVK